MIDIKDRNEFFERLKDALDEYDYAFERFGTNSKDCEEIRRWIKEFSDSAISLGYIEKDSRGTEDDLTAVEAYIVNRLYYIRKSV